MCNKKWLKECLPEKFLRHLLDFPSLRKSPLNGFKAFPHKCLDDPQSAAFSCKNIIFFAFESFVPWGLKTETFRFFHFVVSGGRHHFLAPYDFIKVLKKLI
jgi:hypothetical protein